jgi:tRNA(fMet)-specific endonuclease VapC
MPYLLDSDMLIYYIDGLDTAHALVTELLVDGIAINSVSYMEARQGIGRSQDPPSAQFRLDDLLNASPVIPFDRAEARRCAEIRELLQSQGKRVRPRALDLMIAATALEHDLTLVTNNSADYKDVPGLQLRTERVL